MKVFVNEIYGYSTLLRIHSPLDLKSHEKQTDSLIDFYI